MSEIRSPQAVNGDGGVSTTVAAVAVEEEASADDGDPHLLVVAIVDDNDGRATGAKAAAEAANRATERTSRFMKNGSVVSVLLWLRYND